MTADSSDSSPVSATRLSATVGLHGPHRVSTLPYFVVTSSNDAAEQPMTTLGIPRLGSGIRVGGEAGGGGGGRGSAYPREAFSLE